MSFCGYLNEFHKERENLVNKLERLTTFYPGINSFVPDHLNGCSNTQWQSDIQSVFVYFDVCFTESELRVLLFAQRAPLNRLRGIQSQSSPLVSTCQSLGELCRPCDNTYPPTPTLTREHAGGRSISRSVSGGLLVRLLPGLVRSTGIKPTHIALSHTPTETVMWLLKTSRDRCQCFGWFWVFMMCQLGGGAPASRWGSWPLTLLVRMTSTCSSGVQLHREMIGILSSSAVFWIEISPESFKLYISCFFFINYFLFYSSGEMTNRLMDHLKN